MPTADYRVTVVLDYTAQWDDDDQAVDTDVLHDLLVDAFDSIDLEANVDHVIYDDAGDETERVFAINLICDNVRELDVVELKD